MNVLFISISSLPHISEHSISLDLIHEFQRNGHNVFVVCAIEKREDAETYIQEEAGCQILRVKVGNNKKAGIIEKGLTTVFLPRKYIAAIKKYYNDVKFDLVLYPTPPVTQVSTVKYIKKRDGAKTYLLLKDIFPQNAVDLGMMTKTGLKGILYRYFRHQEKQLYYVSNRIGCMSQANVDYVLEHNPEVSVDKIEVCPNSIEVVDKSISAIERECVRKKYGIPLEKKVFIYGGNLGKPQGIPFLVECLKQQIEKDEVYFIIVGDGTEYETIEIFFKEYRPSNMKLIKRLPKDDYDKLVAACDVGMIFLDYRFSIPNYPSRLLGYLQAALPVLACTDSNTDIGITIADGAFGWSCLSNDVEAFNSMISKIEKADCKMLGLNGYEYLKKNFDVSKAYTTIVM